MKQVCVTPAMGKRLIGTGVVHAIGKAMVFHPAVKDVLVPACAGMVIIGGATNGYVAEEILRSLGQADGFSRLGFRRGLTAAPGASAPTMA